MGSYVNKQGIVSACAGGGDNLIPNSGPTDLTGWTAAGTDWSRSLVNCSASPTGKAIRATFSGSSGVQGGVHHQPEDYTKLKNGVVYTLSAWIRASKACNLSFFNESMTNRPYASITTSWKWYTITSTIDTSRTYHSNIFYVPAAEATQNMWIEIHSAKLEEAKIASAWGYNSAINEGIRHGFGEKSGTASIYDDYIQASEFIEW